ncbi:MAG: PAS domain S-box protein [Proteobacteria bacterium]|nr:PAS domain S-box protein [Pseudomonadota bacterium]
MGTMELALKMLPKTKHVFFLGGASLTDRMVEKKARKDLLRYQDRLDLNFWTDLTADEILKRVGKLPKDSIIYFLIMLRDAAGKPIISRDMVAKVSSAANAPVFSLWDSYFGSGIVGGKMCSAELQGKTAAQLGLRILAGENPADIQPSHLPNVDMFDWRQLKRWNLLDVSLPAGSIVRYVHLSTFERYQKYIIGAIALLLLEALLVVGLFINLVHKRRAMKALKESEAKYRSIFQNVQDIYYEASLDGKIMEISPSVSSFSQYSREDLLGKSLEDIYEDPNDRIRFLEQIQKTGGIRDNELRLLDKDGSIRICSQNAVLVRDEQGNPMKFVGSLRDITDRKLVESDLQESEAKWRSLAESSPDHILTLDTHFNVEYANFASPGLTVAELIGTPLYQYVDQGRQAEIKAVLEGVLATRKPARYETEYVNTDGSITYYESHAAPRIISDKVSGVTVIARDITDRKNVENELKASRERIAAILEANPDPVVVYDKQGIAQFINPAFTKVFGWTPKDVLGRRTPFVPDEEFDKTMLNIKELYSSSDPVSFVSKRFTKSGEVLDVFINGAPIRRDDGTPIGMVGNIRDITDSIKMEAQLRQSQKMEAVGTLAGGIAHDFNNILAAVMGYAEIALAEAEEGRPNQEEIQGILQAAIRAKGLVQQILTFSRRADSKLGLVDVNKEILIAANLLKQTLPKMIDLRLELSEEISSVMGDPQQIEQILMNMATNSRDAMPGGGTITIATGQQTVEGVTCLACTQPFAGDYVIITVNDTGLGIKEEDLEKIFDPFFTTKDVGKGTGLGLSTVFGIVNSHDGHITCASTPGEGTTVTIYLPPTQNKTIETLADQLPEAVQGGRETILLVDDEMHILDIGTQHLSRAGYKVFTAPDGEEALAVFRARGEEIDLVILDLSMPGMGGHKCLQELLALEPNLRVIVSTGYSRDGDLRKTLSSGAAALLSKPFGKNEMLKIIRMVLNT